MTNLRDMYTKLSRRLHVRFWESDIMADPQQVVTKLLEEINKTPL